MSILFSNICQFLTFYLVKSSPKNPRWKLERRRSICAGTVFATFRIIEPPLPSYLYTTVYYRIRANTTPAAHKKIGFFGEDFTK